MAKGSKPLRTPKFDWVALRTDYVQTTLSLRQLAAKHKVSLRQLVEHSKTEGWVEAREQFRVRVASTADEQGVEKHAKALTQGREMATANATAIMGIIATKLGMNNKQRPDFAKLAKEMDTLSLLRLAKSNDAAFLSLCKALGIVPVDAGNTGGAEVDLPSEPMNALDEGVSEAVDGGDEADEG